MKVKEIKPSGRSFSIELTEAEAADLKTLLVSGPLWDAEKKDARRAGFFFEKLYNQLEELGVKDPTFKFEPAGV